MNTYLLRYSEIHPEIQKGLFIIFSVVFAVVGTGMIISFFKNKNKNIGYYPGNNLLFGLFFILWGIVSFVVIIYADISVFFLMLFLFLIIFFSINTLLQFSYLKKCTYKIKAKLDLCYTSSPGRTFSTFYIPIFSYTYNGEDYRVRSLQNFRETKIKKRRKSLLPEDGSFCEIYINPDDPRMNIYTTDIRKNIMSDIVLIIIFMCVFFLLLVFYLM